MACLPPELRFDGYMDAWERRKFSDLVVIERGGSPRPIEDFITENPDGLNWVKIGDAPSMGRYITSTAEKIKPEGASKTRFVHPGDLVLSNSMSFGHPYIMGIDGCIHDGWLLIRDTCGVFDPVYLCHMLGTDNMFNQYRMVAAGSAVNNLNKGLVGNAIVLFPKMLEQKVIGSFFDDFDSLINLHQREYDKLATTKQAMLQKMFPKPGEDVPEVRFDGFEGPWAPKSLRDITYLAGMKNRDNLPLESYSVTSERGFMPQDEKFENGGTMRDADKSFYTIVTPNTFAYNPARINVGSIGYWDGADDVIVSSLYEVFKTTNDVDDRFLWRWFKSDLFPPLIEKYQEGGVRLYFFYDKLCKCEMMLPCIEEQKLIATFFDNLEVLISLKSQELDKLKQVKSALLQKMFV